MSKNKLQSESFLNDVGTIASELDALGFNPVLVGGMALVFMGSERVTQDFDFVVSAFQERFKELIAVFYNNGFELASRLDEQGKITVTLDNRRVAAARLSIDLPTSIYFLNLKTGLQIDVLFDFPIAAQELAAHAKKMKISSQIIPVANERDLLRLKEIAVASRSKSGDAEDIVFLKAKISAM